MSESASKDERSDATAAQRDELQRMLYREFLLEPDLHLEAGLESLPEQLGKLLRCAAADAIDRVTQSPELESISLDELRQVLAIRDMQLVSRTAAAVAAELKEPGVSYDRCIRTALCYAVAAKDAHVFSALRVAGSKRDDWARHHFLYGLMHGVAGNHERAAWELEMALEREPYEDGRVRIRQAITLVEEAIEQTAEAEL